MSLKSNQLELLFSVTVTLEQPFDGRLMWEVMDGVDKLEVVTEFCSPGDML